MSRIIRTVVKAAGLALTLAPSLLFLAGVLDLGGVKTAMTVGMVLWFGAAGVEMASEKNDN